MTFQIAPEPDVEAALKKLAKKDPVRFGQLEKKLRELADNLEIEKALEKPLHGSRRHSCRNAGRKREESDYLPLLTAD
jgi:mRNA-degrading endonuclease RelE of RelBE toxin-antitoxin system